MKDKGNGDTCRNGNDAAPAPIRENTKGKYHEASLWVPKTLSGFIR
jgi:hypothetical protein